MARDQTRALEMQPTRELAQVFDARKKDGKEHVSGKEGELQATISRLQANLNTRDARVQDLAVRHK